MRLAGAVAVAAGALTLAVTASAAPPVQLVEAGGAQFPYRSYVVTLPTAQTLPVSRLHVTENGTPVRGLSVISAEAAKQSQFGIVLAIDASDSMRGRPIAAAVSAARAFAAHRSPNQQLGIVTFNRGVHVLQPLTTSSSEIEAALSSIPSLSYGTHIYDALSQSAELLAAAHVQGGSIVLLSDGADVGSAAKPAAVLSALAAAHLRAFTVGFVSSAYDPGTLQRIASTTRASYTKAATPAALTPIYDALGYELSREYLLSYQSLAGPNVHVNVRVHVAGLPGTAASEYVTPALQIAPAPPPYHSSGFGRFVQSPYTAAVVALLAAAIFGWAIMRIASPGSGTLVERVGSFVSLRRAPVEGDLAAPRRRVDLLHGAEGALERLRWWPRFKATLELADIDASPTQIVLLTLLGTLVATLILYLVLGFLGAVLGLVVVPIATRTLIQTKLARKRRLFAEQLPDNLEVMAAALRGGHSLIASMSAVVETAPEPSNSEFRRVIAEEQLGVPLEDAIATVVERMDNRDLDQVALVARLQREAGSSAAEVIDRVIETVRSRAELRRLVQTLTAQGRLSRWVLTGLPIGLALILPVLSRGYLHPLFHRTLGVAMVIMAALMVTAGSIIIGKIVNIRV